MRRGLPPPPRRHLVLVVLNATIEYCVGYKVVLCLPTGTKLTVVPGFKQSVLMGGGRMPLFLVHTLRACAIVRHSSHLYEST